MQKNKKVFDLILIIILSLGAVFTTTKAVTIIGNNVSIERALSITATTTALGSVILENTADLTVGSATSTFAGDVSLGDGQGDNIRINGTISSATTTLLSIGGGQMISKHLSGTGVIDVGALSAGGCIAAGVQVAGSSPGDITGFSVPPEYSTSSVVFSPYSYSFLGSTLSAVKVCNIGSVATSDFPSGTMRMDVWKY